MSTKIGISIWVLENDTYEYYDAYLFFIEMKRKKKPTTTPNIRNC